MLHLVKQGFTIRIQYNQLQVLFSACFKISHFYSKTAKFLERSKFTPSQNLYRSQKNTFMRRTVLVLAQHKTHLLSKIDEKSLRDWPFKLDLMNIAKITKHGR